MGKREGVDEGVKELGSTAKVQRGGSSERWRGGERNGVKEMRVTYYN